MTKLNIKIAFFDIDGTLTNDNKEVLNSTISALNEASESGIKLALCSGRSHQYILKHSKLFKNIDYLISSNGARIFDVNNDKNLYMDTLKDKDINNIWEQCNKNKLCLTITGDKNAYINKFTKISNEDIYMKRINSLEDILKENLYQLIVVNDNLNNMINLEKYLQNIKDIKLINYNFNYINKKISNYYFFDIVNNNVSKGNAINILLKYLDIKKENTLCFGDSINDIDMFKSCGVKVAMENAIDSLKKESDFIADSNNNDGISKFLNKYILSD